MTPSGIEPATFRFVAQRLDHCATAVPHPPEDSHKCGRNMWKPYCVHNITLNVYYHFLVSSSYRITVSYSISFFIWLSNLKYVEKAKSIPRPPPHTPFRIFALPHCAFCRPEAALPFAPACSYSPLDKWS